MAPIQEEINNSLGMLRAAGLRIGLYILAASLAGNVILGGVVFLKVRAGARLQAEISQADLARRAAISEAAKVRASADQARQEAAGAMRGAAQAAAGIAMAEGSYQAEMTISEALESYRRAGGDLQIFLEDPPGGPQALQIRPMEASEALKRIQLYPGLRAANGAILAAIWTVSNAMEAGAQEAAAERRAREAAERSARLWEKAYGSGETRARLQGASVAGLAAIGALVGGLVGKDAPGAILGGLAGAGAGVGVAVAIGRAGNSNVSKFGPPILYLIR